MPHKALDVAKALLHYTEEYNRPITNLHLQKLLYYAQGFSYAMTGYELFADDMYAWKYGPAVPRVYEYYHSYVAYPITPEKIDIEQFDSYDTVIIREVARRIGGMDPWKLAKRVCQEPPWRKNCPMYWSYSPCDNIIPKEDIQGYFCKAVTDWRKS